MGCIGAMTSKLRESDRSNTCLPLVVVVLLFQAGCLALKSPAIMVEPLRLRRAERSLLRRFLSSAGDGGMYADTMLIG